MMHIVYCSQSSIPSKTANSVHVMKMAAAFSSLGHTLTLLAPHRTKETELVADVWSYYGVSRTFTLLKLSWPKWKGKTVVYAAACAWQARKVKPDIVYGRFLLGTYFCALAGLPVAFELHSSLRPSSFDQWIGRRLLRHKNLHRVVVISEALRQHVIRTYCIKPEQVTVAHDSASPLRPTTPAILKGERTACLQIGYVGSLNSGKGMELIARLAAYTSQYNFHIIGGNQAAITEWQRKTNHLTNLQFYGHVPHATTSAYLAAFDVVLAPYQTKVAPHGGAGNIAEFMSPLKLFEYMAAQKAIVCSDLPVLREILTDRTTALLCPPTDTIAWGAALQSLENTAERTRLATNAYRTFCRQHTWKQRATNILSVLDPTIPVPTTAPTP